jgi:hypothetical protein
VYYIENSLGELTTKVIKRLLVFVPLLLGASEDFISHYEYGQMLYNNPRGVSCSECHGENGEGRTIVSYKDVDGEKKVIKGSDIRKKSFSCMLDSVDIYIKLCLATTLQMKKLKPFLIISRKKMRTIFLSLKRVKAANKI